MTSRKAQRRSRARQSSPLGRERPDRDGGVLHGHLPRADANMRRHGATPIAPGRTLASASARVKLFAPRVVPGAVRTRSCALLGETPGGPSPRLVPMLWSSSPSPGAGCVPTSAPCAPIPMRCATPRARNVSNSTSIVCRPRRERRRLLQTTKSSRPAEPGLEGNRQPQGRRTRGADREMQRSCARIKQLDEETKRAEADFDGYMFARPEPAGTRGPRGRKRQGQRRDSPLGTPRSFDFEPRDHVAIGIDLDLVDFERAAKIAGARTYFLKGAGVQLELAVLRLALVTSPPRASCRCSCRSSCGRWRWSARRTSPRRGAGVPEVERDGVSLIGTAEGRSRLSRARDSREARAAAALCGLSPCFRARQAPTGATPAGSIAFTSSKKWRRSSCAATIGGSQRWHAAISRTEELVQLLGLPYRVVTSAAATSPAAGPKFDIGLGCRRAAAGGDPQCVAIHDFQARRLDSAIGMRAQVQSATRSTHNTVIASPRILIPILENYQLADGSGEVPAALRRTWAVSRFWEEGDNGLRPALRAGHDFSSSSQLLVLRRGRTAARCGGSGLLIPVTDRCASRPGG